MPAPSATPALTELDAYAQKQWESLLLFLVDPTTAPPAMPSELGAESADVPGLLCKAGLMVKNEYTDTHGEQGWGQMASLRSE